VDAEKVRKILSEYREIKLDFSYIPDQYKADEVDRVEIRLLLPFFDPGGIDEKVATKVARNHGLGFENYNLNKGKDEPPLYRPTFLSVCRDESEIRSEVEKIIRADRELDVSFEELSERW